MAETTDPHEILNDPVRLIELREIAKRVAREAGELIVTDRPTALGVADTKSSETDVVTVMDQRSEQLLRERLAELRPHDGLLGEEGASRPSESGLTWIVDPIDGTVNYLYEHPFYAVSVAVVIGDASGEDGWDTVAAAVYAPAMDEMFSAALGQGATLEADGVTTDLHVNDPHELSLALIGTGFGYAAQKRAVQAAIVAELLPKARDIRRGGSAALDLCFVAGGRLDAYYESGINAWDRAAGQLIAAEAGAIVSGEIGEKPGKNLTIAAAPKVYAELASCVGAKTR